MSTEGTRRAFLTAALPLALLSRAAARQSTAERLVAAIQDGGKIIYLRYPAAGGVDEARDLGRALYALRVPLNEILAAPLPQARRTAEMAFGTDRLHDARELVDAEKSPTALATLRQFLRTVPGPGMNRVLVGDRAPLELAAERQFPDAVLPEGAMAVFVSGENTLFLGTMTGERVIASAKARGALPSR